jgi:hypothetical protein
MSAMLNIAQYGNWMKSTTKPWNGPGARNIRSIKLPNEPPSSPPASVSKDDKDYDKRDQREEPRDSGTNRESGACVFSISEFHKATQELNGSFARSPARE